MTGYDITERVTSGLVSNTPSGAAYTSSTFAYDYAIAGQPFLAATNDQAPYQRALAQIRKQQIDQSQQPGEQSLEGWWLRSQVTFHSGAGIKYLEPSNDLRIMRRFADSRGIDVWTLGQFSLLPAMSAVAGVGQYVAGCQFLGVDALVACTGSTVTVIDPLTGVTVNTMTGVTGTILGAVSTGDRVVLWTATDVYVSDATGTSVSSHYSATGVTNVWFVKQRLVVATGNTLTEVTANWGSTAVATTITTHPNPSWVWTSACNTPDTIMLAGYAGTISAVYKITVSTAGSVTALTAPAVAVELPLGEIVQSLFSYMGGFIVLGTNLGVRVATINSYYGTVTYGPLSIRNVSVTGLLGRDRFVYAATSNGIDDQHGVYRLDLSDQDPQFGFFAYTADLQTTVSAGTLQSMCLAGGKLWLGLSNGDAWRETSTLLSSGWLKTGLIRYGTLEPKLFKRFRMRGTVPVNGTVTVASILGDGTETSLYGYTHDFPDAEFQVSPATAQDVMQFRFTLTSDGSESPIVTAYQARSLPAVKRNELIRLNLLCFDSERSRNGTMYGHLGTAKGRFNALRDAVANGDIVRVQDFSTGESVDAIIEDLQFTQTSPPNPSVVTAGFGGIIQLTARTVT